MAGSLDSARNRIDPEVRVCPDLVSLSHAVAGEIVHLARTAVQSWHGRFTLALAGGTTPRTLYRLLAAEYRKQIPWFRVHLFWGDERFAPPTSSESNYAMAYETLISQVPIPPAQVHRIPAESDPPDQVAQVYEKHLRDFFAETSPTFDLILLGAGPDGHTASLFPNDPVLTERECWVRAVLAPPVFPPLQRITLTLPAINQANAVFLMVSGTGKREIVQSLLKTPEIARRLYPAAMVRPVERLVWWVDQAAGGVDY